MRQKQSHGASSSQSNLKRVPKFVAGTLRWGAGRHRNTNQYWKENNLGVFKRKIRSFQLEINELHCIFLAYLKVMSICRCNTYLSFYSYKPVTTSDVFFYLKFILSLLGFQEKLFLTICKYFQILFWACNICMYVLQILIWISSMQCRPDLNFA